MAETRVVVGLVETRGFEPLTPLRAKQVLSRWVAGGRAKAAIEAGELVDN